jgi:hypothetical protein
MNVPTLPTDNLYKFLALTGLVLMLACFGALEFRAAKQQELDTAVSLGKEALGYLERDIERVAERLTGQATEDQEYPKVTANEYAQFKMRIRNVGEDIIELRGKSERAEAHYQRTQRILFLLLLGGIFGGFIAIAGFALWYVRLQKYQDVLIRCQADQSAQQAAQADAENRAA